ncbi:MAG: tetratricopeptide repeat protein [PVC group bacterium]
MRNSASIGLAISLLVVLNGIAFFPALPGSFLNWDDEENVVFHQKIRTAGTDGFLWIFTDFTVGDFKPLAWIGYSFDYAFWRLNPFGYHLENLLIHAASAALAFALLYRLGRRLRPGAEAAPVFPAFIAAVFFSLHPLRAESVAWISERKDVLCCFFYLASVVAYFRYRERGRPGWYAASLLFALLALLGKPMAVTLPVILILADLLIDVPGRPPGGLRRAAGKIPFFLLALAAGLIALYGQARNQALIPLETIGPGERIVLAARTLVFYLGKLFLPVRLAAAYPSAVPGSAWSAFPAIGLLASVTAAAVFLQRRSGRGALFFWLWFLVSILPVSGLFPAGMAAAADRFTYLPSFGIAGLLWCVLSAPGGRAWNRRAAAPALAGAAFLLLLSHGQTVVWRESESLWRNAVETCPDTPMARAHLGQILYQRGDDEAAIRHLRRALEMMDGDPMAREEIVFAARSNLARALGRSGSPEAGAAILEEILESRDDWVTHHSLAGLYARMGKKEEALRAYERVLADRPGFVPALCEYGLLLAQAGMSDRAMAVYHRALSILPDSPRARYNLSLTYLDRGETGRAIALLEMLVKEYPGVPRIADALAIACRLAGRHDAAEKILTIPGGEGEDNVPYSKGERPDLLIPIR